MHIIPSYIYIYYTSHYSFPFYIGHETHKVFICISSVLEDYNYCKVLADQLPPIPSYIRILLDCAPPFLDVTIYRRIVDIKSVLFSLGKFTENNEIICPEFTTDCHIYISNHFVTRQIDKRIMYTRYIVYTGREGCMTLIHCDIVCVCVQCTPYLY